MSNNQTISYVPSSLQDHERLVEFEISPWEGALLMGRWHHTKESEPEVEKEKGKEEENTGDICFKKV